MSLLEKIVKLTKAQYNTLTTSANHTISYAGGTHTYSDNNLYFITDETVSATDLGEDFILPVSHGGTGKTSFTVGSVLVGNGTAAFTELAATDLNTANTIVKRDNSGNFSAEKATLTEAKISSISIAGNKLTAVNAIDTHDSNGLLAYKPASWTGVNNTQWGVGTINAQGVIRSSNTDLLHSRNGTNSVILDAGNYTSYIKYVNLYETRASTTTLNKTANYVAAGAMFHLVASSSTSTTDNGKTPMGDANILQMNWDNNGGYDAQLGIHTADNRMEFRSRASQKQAWREVVTSTPGTAAGGETLPVYINTSGVATAISYTIEKSVPSNAVFTDHYAWGDITGKPTKITLTGAVTGNVSLGEGELTLSTSVNHNHNSSYLTAVGYDTTNKKIYYTKNGTNTDVVTAATLRTDMGLSNALHFIGITSTPLTDGSTTSTLAVTTTGSLSKTTGFVDGDVVMDGDQLREYVWSGSAWRLLGITTSTAYSLTATGNSWIASITQGTDGKITATTGSLVTTGEWSGNAATATTATNLDTAPTITNSSGTSVTDLAAATTYTLTVGGLTVSFKTPSDANTNTLVRTYALATTTELPILAGSTTTGGAWTNYTSSYKNLYGTIASTTENRATINPSTGHITAPGGITANITGNATNVTGTVAIANGGTGKTSAAEAWTALGGGDSGKHADSYFALAEHGTHVTAATVKSALSTGSDTTKFLNNKGEWAVPAYTTSLAWSAITSKPNLPTGNARIFYGTSNTAAGTAAKIVTCSIYDAYTAGDILVVKFDSANTAGSPTLNVNSKGAKNIRKIYNGAVNTLNANGEITGTCIFVYDGTLWLLTNADYSTANDAVTHTVKTTTKYYVTGTETATTSTGGDTFDTGIYATTVAGQLNATSYKVNDNVTLQYNSTEQALEFIFA